MSNNIDNIDTIDNNDEFSDQFIQLDNIFYNNNDTNIIEYIIIIIIIIIIGYLFYTFFYNGTYDNHNNNDNMKDILNNNNNTIIDILKHNSEINPDGHALVVKKPSSSLTIGADVWIPINYEDYYNNVEQFATSLNYWVGARKNVAIIGFNSPAWFYAHLGTIANNGISVGIYPTSTNDICEYIVNDANIDVIVVEDDKQLEKFVDINFKDTKIKLILYYSPVSSALINKFTKSTIPVISFGVFMDNKKFKKNKNINQHMNNNNVDLNDVMTIIYTSGTTGNPKGVEITHKNILAMIKSLLNTTSSRGTLNFDSNEKFVSYLPLNHIAAQTMDIYIPICTGGTVWFADKNAMRSDKPTLVKTLKDAKPTIFVGVPRVWEKMAEAIEKETNYSTSYIPRFLTKKKIIEGIGLDKCKYCITTASPISDTARDYFDSLGITLYDIYGLSETCGPIAVSLPNYRRTDSVGIPFDDLRIKINMDGEILVKGDQIFKAYKNNKKATKEAFERGWFKTGDLGMIDNGYLFITGRKKELIITSGGENIAPVPIEQNIMKNLKDVDYAVVIGNNRKFLSCLLFVKNNKNNGNLNLSIDKIMAKVNDLAPSNAHRVQKWKIIAHTMTIGDELTPTYKLKRDVINKKFKNEIDELYV